MKRILLILLALAVVGGGVAAAVVLLTGGGRGETTAVAGFEYQGWQIVDAEGRAALQVKSTVREGSRADGARLSLIGPSGLERPVSIWTSKSLWELWADSITRDEAGNRFFHFATNFYLTDTTCANEIPPPGEYRLVLEDYWGETLWTKSLSLAFARANLTITGVSASWYYDGYFFYYLESVDITLENNGGLPAYFVLDASEATIDGKSGVLGYGCECVLPGEEKTLTQPYIFITGITPGSKTLTIILKDSDGSTVSTYSTVVTPS